MESIATTVGGLNLRTRLGRNLASLAVPAVDRVTDHRRSRYGEEVCDASFHKTLHLRLPISPPFCNPHKQRRLERHE